MPGNSKVADVITCCCNLKLLIATLNDPLWNPSDQGPKAKGAPVGKPLEHRHQFLPVMQISVCLCLDAKAAGFSFHGFKSE